MKRKMRAAAAVSAVALLSACVALTGCTIVRGSGDITTEERSVSGFDSILVQGGGFVEIIQGDEEGLTITADENLLEYIDTEVRGTTLEITIREQTTQVMPSEPIRYEVRLRELSDVKLDGSVELIAEGLQADDLVIDSDGSAGVEISDLEADSVEFTVSGSGESAIDGEVGEQELSVSGSGSFNNGDLATESTRVSISGSGEATVWATDELEIDVSGSGSVSYYGSPTVTQNLSGSEDIESLGDK
jgi:hypothetical protein